MGVLVFRMQGDVDAVLSTGRLADDKSTLEITRGGLDANMPSVRVRYTASETDHMPAVAWAEAEAADEVVDVDLPIAMDEDQARQCARGLSETLRLSRTSAQFAMAADGMVIEAGDVVSLDGETWRVTERSDARGVSFKVARAGEAGFMTLTPALPANAPAAVATGVPDVVIVDPPALPGQEDDLRPLGFAFVEPWPSRVLFEAGASVDQLSVRGGITRPCTMGRLGGAIFPHVSGRWQEASIWVDVVGGDLSSRTEGAVLNGANIALVETDTGWEMLQHRDAVLVGPRSYRLDGLLRGQQGTETAMASGAFAGNRVLFLTGAETRLDIASWERGLELVWRGGAPPFVAGGIWQGTQAFDAVAQREWSPAHVHAHWSGGNLELSWIRRARKDGDPWAAGEPPLGAAERYRVRVSGGGGVREWDVEEARANYAEAEQAADFPAGGDALIEAAQLGADGQPGGLGQAAGGDSSSLSGDSFQFCPKIPIFWLVLL